MDQVSSKPLLKARSIEDMAVLVEAVNHYFDFIASNIFHEDALDDIQNEIFEKAVECLFGEGAWAYTEECWKFQEGRGWR